MTIHDADESTDTGKPDRPRAGGGSLYARTWDTDEPAPVPAHPAPEVRSRPVEPDEITRGVRTVINALGPGWVHAVRYSRGHTPLNRTPWIGKIADVLRLDLRHRVRPVGAVAIWEAGKAAYAYTWTVCTDPGCARAHRPHPADTPARITSTELRALVREAS